MGGAFTTNGMGVISVSVTYTVQLLLYIWVRVYNKRYGCYQFLCYLYCTFINIYMGARLQQTLWVLSVSLLPILYSYKYIYGCAFTTNGMGVISFFVTYTVQL